MNNRLTILLIIIQITFPELIFCQIEKNKIKKTNLTIEDYRKHAMTHNGNPALGEKIFTGKRRW